MMLGVLSILNQWLKVQVLGLDLGSDRMGSDSCNRTFPSCVSSGKWLGLAEPQLFSLSSEDDNSVCFGGQLWEWDVTVLTWGLWRPSACRVPGVETLWGQRPSLPWPLLSPNVTEWMNEQRGENIKPKKNTVVYEENPNLLLSVLSLFQDSNRIQTGGSHLETI